MSEISALEYMENIIRIQNYKESLGVVILKTGGAIPIDSYFNFFFDTWMVYSNPETKDTIKSPLVTNGDISIHLDEVAVMIKTEDFEEFEEY